MKDLSFNLKMLCQKNREGSFSTIAARQKNLVLIGNQLDEIGYRHLKSAQQLKPKHIYALIKHWRDSGIATATIKNRMTHLRWLAAKIQNPNLVSSSNDHYGIEKRVYVDNQDKATVFDSEKLANIRDPHVRLSAELQKVFGLRREESMKLIPSRADEGSHLALQGSWTKGGKPRKIPINNDEQRSILRRAKALAGQGSMIPSARRYVQHLRIFEKEMYRVGLGKTHGARHLYAQTRYKDLSGREPPVKGGLSRRRMSASERKIDDQVRLQISRELGHERIQIVAIYIGS